jgi:chromosome segregation ATPase
MCTISQSRTIASIYAIDNFVPSCPESETHIATLTQEKPTLQYEISSLRSKLGISEDTSKRLRAKNQELQKQIFDLNTQNRKLTGTLLQYQATIRELEETKREFTFKLVSRKP